MRYYSLSLMVFCLLLGCKSGENIAPVLQKKIPMKAIGNLGQNMNLGQIQNQTVDSVELIIYRDAEVLRNCYTFKDNILKVYASDPEQYLNMPMKMMTGPTGYYWVRQGYIHWPLQITETRICE